MTPEQEFKSLNAKVLDGSARDNERERWKKLRDHLRAAKQPRDDARQHQRSAVSIDVTFANDEALIRAVSSDLGAGGLGLALDGTYEIDSEYRLDLTLPGAPAAVQVRARVAWATGGHVGFEFLALPKALQDRIDALVWEEVDLSDL